MLRKLINNTLLILLLFCVVCFSSCTLFRPLPLNPVHDTDSVQRMERPDFSKFNGNYQIQSVDSNSDRLDYALTYKSVVKWDKVPGKNDYINLSTIGNRRIKATLFKNDKKIKSKTLKGKMINNYFEFHSTHLSLKYIFFLYAQQTNRISLSKEDDLYLDTNSGGIGFLLILPIPLSGSSMDAYNLKFKRKK